MPNAQVEQLVTQIMQALPGAGDIETAVEQVRAGLENLNPGLSISLADELATARSQVEQHFDSIEILQTHSIFKKRQKWYLGPRPTDRHWPALKDYLFNAKGFALEDIQSIDESSNEVVSLLANPNQQNFSCRGLVVGHVQSGKTANMTAVMAKALDAGYDTIIVLAGLTNKLRYQTQVRMYNDLVSRNPLEWQLHTPNELDRDFKAPPQGGFLAHSNKAQIAVIKKNVSPLDQLKRAISETLPAALKQLRILVIDDECDQASVNAARNELDVTAINQKIREIISFLPAVSYVGYTATPFANVLINPYPTDGRDLDDLYPSDFITSLPIPASYFGTERLFGRTPEDPENPSVKEEGLDMIRDIPNDDELMLQPQSRKHLDTFEPEMPESLEKAILYFLSCCAARRSRGHSDNHMTMLVHTSAYVAAHGQVAALIKRWFDANEHDITHPDSHLGKRIAKIWDQESGCLPEDITPEAPVALDQVFSFLSEVISDLEFPIENGASDDRIDYERRPRTYIVVGGSILARGLTLEGLMVSYFLRSASQYDTLLQMGRWFGFRSGYEDLPRIWMPEDLKFRFRALADIEQEIRDEIAQYSTMDLTPLDVAVQIRAIPGMAITASNKMKAARKCAISFWGSHRQTFRFNHDSLNEQSNNWEAGATLIDAAQSVGLRVAGEKKLWRGVPRQLVIDFFEAYRTHAQHAELNDDLLLGFLNGPDERLDIWNIGIIEPRNGKASEIALGAAGEVKLVSRAKLKDENPPADIKALMSKSDVHFDCENTPTESSDWDGLKEFRMKELGEVPLLLLYAINKDSKPKTTPAKTRAPLDAVHHVLGYGIVFPGRKAEGGNMVAVELRSYSAEELEEIEREENAQAEAAGV